MRAAAVVVNHNGGPDVARCLAALAAQTVPVEVVLVDCASHRRLARARRDAAGRRAGLALAGEPRLRRRRRRRPRGALRPRSRWSGFLNPDCFAAPDFFAAALRCLAAIPAPGRRRGAPPAPRRRDARLLRPGAHAHAAARARPRLRRARRETLPRGGARARRLRRRHGVPARGARRGRGRRRRLPGGVLRILGGPRSRLAGEQRGLAACVYEPTAVAVHHRAARTAAPGRGPLMFRRPPRGGGVHPRQSVGDAGCATCTRLISARRCPYCCSGMSPW